MKRMTYALASLLAVLMFSSCSKKEHSDLTFELTIPQQGIYVGTYDNGEESVSAGITFTHASSIKEYSGTRTGRISIGGEEGSLKWVSDQKIVRLTSSLDFLDGEWFLLEYNDTGFLLMKGTGAEDAPGAELEMERKN